MKAARRGTGKIPIRIDALLRRGIGRTRPRPGRKQRPANRFDTHRLSNIGVHCARHPSEDSMDRFPSRSELSEPEMMSLREIVAASFMSRASLPADRRARLLTLGLIQSGMGGVMPTPMGRMLARQ
jgi:hypothetical protein